MEHENLVFKDKKEINTPIDKFSDLKNLNILSKEINIYRHSVPKLV